MAKLKIRGLMDMVSGPDSEAIAIREGLDSKTIMPEEWVSFGAWSGKARDISSIVVEQTNFPDSGFSERLQQYNDERNAVLALPPAERAARCAWGPFKLFYYGVKQTAPDESLRPAVLAAAERWYTENPRWSVPSVKAWYALLGIESGYNMLSPALRILERVEAAQYEAIHAEGYQVVA